ncbi:conserved hypothetical protein [Sphingobacterium multivorum]|jgi:hypothetical protein|uniref:Uncharacterized protein n=1 Tax=Sphingobacterium multivorum TaxID=28454 RepID=A0A654DJ36_SPHMU|nr:conserved hypothetical protein [Sphingobacterium multivorum]
MENQMLGFTRAPILNNRFEKIFRYLDAYNKMDDENMIADFADRIIFINIMNDEKSM